jgi:undecaprenyl phosphate N,N'-diacetylbacillosamine 1-phosphate transferase
MVAAAGLLIIFSPLLLVVSVYLLLYNMGSPFFFQDRPGKNEAIFKLIKFKTMKIAYDEEGNLLPDKERITRAGRFIRAASLDELPQLINVMKGDMSLIGPRPLLVKYLPLYSDRQRRRHEVRPGITGWAQVNGRNTVTWPARFEMDLYYVDNLSLALDIKILLLTFKKVITREGVNASQTTTMEPFKGNIHNT